MRLRTAGVPAFRSAWSMPAVIAGRLDAFGSADVEIVAAPKIANQR